MNQAKNRQAARGQRTSPGYSMPFDICSTLYLQGEVEQTQMGLKSNKLKHKASNVNAFKQLKWAFCPQSEAHLKYSSLGLT